MERRALRLLAAGWHILNAQGPTKANSVLTDGRERLPLGRNTMARLRDMRLIAYVPGHPALATITDMGRRVAAVQEVGDGSAAG